MQKCFVRLCSRRSVPTNLQQGRISMNTSRYALVRDEIVAEVNDKLRRTFGSDPKEASAVNIFKACALVIRDILAARMVDSDRLAEKNGERQVHYLSLEFLIGRSLEKNAYNLSILGIIEDALRELGFDPAEFFEVEPDAALGNGGLGRLAACYLEAMTTGGYKATGYSILYEYGIFKQKIIDCEQQELPDKWLDIDDIWLLREPEDVCIVRFGGKVDYEWREDRMVPRYIDSTEVRAVPADMLIGGYNCANVNRLRLWTAQPVTEVDMDLFSQGKYLRAVEARAMAEVITKLLYPEDNHYEGKMLRLRQQYFFVSATAQDIVRKHLQQYGTLENFDEKHIIQINDTHPTVVIPELMRIFMDEHGLGWDEAWRMVSNSVAYTNHTVLAEALECWPMQLVRTLLPRIYDIILEIHNRFERTVEGVFGDDQNAKRELSILYDGQVRMANICIAACRSVNGVSALHTEILKNKVFAYAYRMYPQKFVNVTNGIDHRRWLGQANPLLAGMITGLIGEGWQTDASELSKLSKYSSDEAVLGQLSEIKLKNKQTAAKLIRENCGVALDPNSMFDVQAKRLHEYKRQLLNMLHVIMLYDGLKNGTIDIAPQSFIFGAKAAPGYHMAKRIIKLINAAAEEINADPATNDRLRIAFIENYRVSVAERLMPATDLSEQISLAGKEASGTGNMKFMINGALTIGTMDGANVEMCREVGKENMFIFGMSAEEAENLTKSGYRPLDWYNRIPELRAAVDRITAGFGGESFGDVARSLLFDDTYRLFADFESYCAAQKLARETYADTVKWSKMALANIAASGYFAADRSVAEYARLIWNV